MNEDIARVIAEGFNKLLWEERDRLGYCVDGRISLGFTSETVKRGGFSLGKSLKVTCLYSSKGKQSSIFTECSGGEDGFLETITYRLFSLVNDREAFEALVKDEYTSK